MKRFILTLLLILGALVPAAAQVTIPNTFTPQTVAQSALVNANFAQLGNLALNRSGGTITGNISVSGGVTIDGIDIGSVLGGTGTPTFATLTVTDLSALTTVTISNTGASALDVAGGIQAGTGNVPIITADGRIQAISTAFFASLSGANLIGIPETAITDGAILARVASLEIISAQWIFTGASVDFFNVQPLIKIIETDQIIDNQRWWIVPVNGSLNFQARSGDESAVTTVLGLGRSGSASTLVTISAGMAYPNRIAPATLPSGNTNNYAPTGFANAYFVRVTPNAANSTITGIAGGTDGREFVLCRSVTAGALVVSSEDVNSTAANRISSVTAVLTTNGAQAGECIRLFYDGSLSRWVITATSQS